MGKKSKIKQKHHAERHQKKLEKKRKREKLKKKEAHILHQESHKMPDEESLLEMYEVSDSLWDLPQLQTFNLPVEPLLELIEQEDHKEHRPWNKRPYRRKEPNMEEIIVNQERLLHAGLTPEATADLESRLLEAAEMYYDKNFQYYVFIKSLIDLIENDEHPPLVTVPFFSEMLHRAYPRMLEAGEHRIALLQRFSQKVFSVKDPKEISEEEVKKMAKKSDYLKKFRHFMKQHPEFERQTYKARMMVLEDMEDAVKQGIFDDFLLSPEDMELFYSLFPRIDLLRILRSKGHTEEDLMLIAKTFKKFCKIYEKQNKGRELKNRLEERVRLLKQKGDNLQGIYEAVLLEFDRPFTENPFFFYLFMKSNKDSKDIEKKFLKKA